MTYKTSIVDSAASIGQGVSIGPFCIVGPNVILEDNVELKSHVVIDGRTRIGAGTVIHPFASIGNTPQDLKYRGEESNVVVGKHNVIREYVTIQPGTIGGGMITTIGDHCLFMVGAHIAHDCNIGNHVILANYVSLAGHVHVSDHVIIGGLSAVLQHVRIGQHAMIGGMSAVEKDVIPFGLAKNPRATLDGLNLVGMKRRGFNKIETLDSIKALEQLFKDDMQFAKKLEIMTKDYKDNTIVMQILDFIKGNETRALCRPKY